MILLENLNTCVGVLMAMNRRVLRSQTESFRKLYIQYEDDNISSVTYLLKFQDSAVRFLLAVRSIVCEIQLHPQWKYHLVMQLKISRCFRLRFFCWVLAMLEKTEGTFFVIFNTVVVSKCNSSPSTAARKLNN